MEFKTNKVDTQIERRILTAMIVSKEVLQNIQPHINPDHFANSYVRKVSKWILEYYAAYNKAPFDNIQNIYLTNKRKLDEPEQTLIENLLLKISIPSTKFVSKGGRMSSKSICFLISSHIGTVSAPGRSRARSGRRSSGEQPELRYSSPSNRTGPPRHPRNWARPGTTRRCAKSTWKRIAVEAKTKDVTTGTTSPAAMRTRSWRQSTPASRTGAPLRIQGNAARIHRKGEWARAPVVEGSR